MSIGEVQVCTGTKREKQATMEDIHNCGGGDPLPVLHAVALLPSMAKRAQPQNTGSDLPFGEVLRRLREVRGLRQKDLADAAMVSESTVRKAELEPDRPIKRSTAIALMKALEASQPLNPLESQMFIRAANLEEILRSVGAVMEPISQAIKSAGGKNLAFTNTLRKLCSLVPPDHARAFLLLADILDSAGASNALKLLEAAAAMSGTSGAFSTAQRESTFQELDVVHPPESKGTYTEQRITTYAKPTNPAPTKPAKRREA